MFSTGECLSREQAWYLLSILSGQTFDDRLSQNDDDFSFLPEVIRSQLYDTRH